MDKGVKGCKELLNEVIDVGLCTLCGACAGGCPYLVHSKGKIVLMDSCSRSDGQCYQYCPRTYVDMDAISQKVFGVPYTVDELGTAKEVLMARSTDSRIKQRAQYGGTVTTLLSLALAEGLIDGAVLAKTLDDKTPGAVLARNAEGVLRCAGSSYMACPILQAYNRIPKDVNHALAVVGVPCQVLAISKMKREPGIEGWNTVIIRTDAGAELMQVAKAKGKLETDNLPPQNLAHLKEAALLKKKRALKEIVKRSGDKNNLLYVGLSPNLADKLLA